MKKTISIMLLFSILLSLFPTFSFAVNGDVYSKALTVGKGLDYITKTEDFSGNNRLQSFGFEYTPNSSVTPIVEYGNKLYGMSTINNVVKHAENNGYSVLGAVNADFFNTSTGIPTGIVIKNGALISSDGMWNGVAFAPDGTAYAGAPKMTATMVSQHTGASYPIYAINKDRTGNGITLLGGAYSETSRTNLGGTVVILEKSDASPLSFDEPAVFTVKSVEWLKGSVELSDTQYIMTYNDSYTGSADLATLTPGETLILEMDAEEHFKEALFATGGGDMLVIDGQITEYAKAGTAPRTILGVKDDGSFKIWAIDGRQSVTSMGISLLDCAKLLLSEGYETVINLDGGGSTALSVQLPGDTDPYVVNSPSDGSPRKCATYILFVNNEKPASVSKAQIYPIDPVVMANSQTTVYALGYDKNYNGFGEIGASVIASDGLIEGNKYIAPASAGTYELSANISGVSVTPTTYTVVESPDRMFVLRNGKNITGSVVLSPNESVDFNILAFAQSRKLFSDDTAYSWTVSGNCGTVDSNGIFKASSISGSKGSLTVKAGELSKTITISVGAEPYQIEGFENGFESTVISLPENSASAYTTTNYEYARFGKKALVLEYNDTENATFSLPLSLRSSTDTISLWYKTESDGALFTFTLSDGSALTYQLDSKTWTQITLPVPASYSSISVNSFGTGKVYLDNIFGYFDNGMTDMEAPLIQLMDIANGIYTVSLYENSPFAVKNITVTMDGKTLFHNYDSANNVVTFTNPNLSKPHRFSVSVTDLFGNKAKASFDYVPDNYDIAFKDMGKSWAKSCVYVLSENGVFSSAANFNPSSKATNAMVATMISRYMGINTDNYANVELPFADKDKIADWALPHVKALYSLGIMKGSVTSVGNVFLPDNNISRAQVMTILGRTIERGYVYDSNCIGFDDDSSIPAWAFDHIALLKNLGIVNGYGGQNLVKPLNDIQRSEIASLLYKLY